jgi:LPS-assembly protein
VRTQLPVFVSGDRITGQPDVNAVIEGNAELRRGDTVIRADRLDYTVPDDLAKAQRQGAHQPRRQQLRRLGPGFAGGCV